MERARPSLLMVVSSPPTEQQAELARLLETELFVRYPEDYKLSPLRHGDALHIAQSIGRKFAPGIGKVTRSNPQEGWVELAYPKGRLLVQVETDFDLDDEFAGIAHRLFAEGKPGEWHEL